MHPIADQPAAVRFDPSIAPLHWPHYAIEAAALGTFMISAILVTALLEHPGSPVREAVPSGLARRALIGLAMGVTAAAIFYSPWGQRSGAHMNPAVTLTFLRLGKIAPRDAAFYVGAQFAGGAIGALLAGLAAGGAAADPTVNYAATRPGAGGIAAAFGGELVLSFTMMGAVLFVSNSAHARYTGVIAACLVAIFITVESPLSGMSINPARSLASALPSGSLTSLWIYFIAPPAGMLAAAALYVRLYGRAAVRCAKLHHPAHRTCHFNCGDRRLSSRSPALVTS
jgi:aquaporin Z